MKTITMLGYTGYSKILYIRSIDTLCFCRNNRYFKYDGSLIYEVVNGKEEEQHGMFTNAEKNDIHNLYIFKSRSYV